MSEYQVSFEGPARFPEIRWSQRPDGRFCAEWSVELLATAPSPLPLALRLTGDVDIEISQPRAGVLVVRLVSDAKSTRPEVFSVFYLLIRPAFERGFIAAIEGGDLDVHRYFIEATERSAEQTSPPVGSTPSKVP